MARSSNLPAKRFSAGERTERTLRYVWNASTGGNDVYIDIAKDLSAVNRRAYRQGLYYYVASAYFVNGSDCHVQVNTVPDTWMTKVAWTRAFRKWSKMNRMAQDGSIGSVYPKYHDFKTQMSNGVTLLNSTSADISSPVSYVADEWVTSKFVSSDPGNTDPQSVDTFVTHMLGPTVAGGGAPDVHASIGLLRSAQDTWPSHIAAGEPELDADFDTDPLANLFDAGDSFDDIRLNLDQDNDLTPYDANSWTGGTSVLETSVVATGRTSGGGGALAHLGGFAVPLGLLQIATDDFGATSEVGLVELVLELMPGTYHGVHAERMI